MPRTVVLRLALLAGGYASLVGTAPLAAQGSLGSQGFGYPVGGMSTRASGTAGAFAELDAMTPYNPATIGGAERIVLGVQAEPEYRTLRLASGASERTTSQRIPLLSVLFPFRGGLGIGLSASSFLDRSYTLRTTGFASLDGVPVATQDRLDVRGGIGELRGAVGWRINTRVKVGVGGHFFTGENVAVRSRTFSDTLMFGSVLDSSRVTYFGTGLSVGTELRLFTGLSVLGSYRVGQSLDARIRDTVRTTAHVPDRLGAALRYDGIAGTTVSVGVERVSWSKMQTLGTGLSTAHDALNVRAGLEVQGPQFRGAPILLRGGYARNALPFSVTADQVKETRYALGLGLPVAQEAASLDFSLQRANRVLGNAGTKESAWLLGIGLQIRP